MLCIKYQINIKGQCVNYNTCEIFIPIVNLAFHHINRRDGKDLVIVKTEMPRDPIDNKTESVLISSDTIDKLYEIYKYRSKITQIEEEIHEEVSGCLYDQIKEETDKNLFQLRKDAIEISGFSRSKIHAMNRVELMDIINTIK